MKIETHYKERMSLVEFADKHNLTMEVWERGPQKDLRKGERAFYAKFKGTRVAETHSSQGEGDTPLEAIEDYMGLISGGQSIKTQRIREAIQ